MLRESNDEEDIIYEENEELNTDIQDNNLENKKYEDTSSILTKKNNISRSNTEEKTLNRNLRQKNGFQNSQTNDIYDYRFSNLDYINLFNPVDAQYIDSSQGYEDIYRQPHNFQDRHNIDNNKNYNDYGYDNYFNSDNLSLVPEPSNYNSENGRYQSSNNSTRPSGTIPRPIRTTTPTTTTTTTRPTTTTTTTTPITTTTTTTKSANFFQTPTQPLNYFRKPHYLQRSRSQMLNVRTTCEIAGWGATSTLQKENKEFYVANVGTMHPSLCMKSSKYSNLPPQMLEKIFCAAGINSDNNPVDTCIGDSGGPLVCDVGGRQTLIGITSTGLMCAEPCYPVQRGNLQPHIPSLDQECTGVVIGLHGSSVQKGTVDIDIQEISGIPVCYLGTLSAADMREAEIDSVNLASSFGVGDVIVGRISAIFYDENCLQINTHSQNHGVKSAVCKCGSIAIPQSWQLCRCNECGSYYRRKCAMTIKNI